MQLKLLSISEGAFNNAGRLTIVNTYDIIGSKIFPLKMPLGIAITLFFNADDGGERHVELKIINKSTGLSIAKMESSVMVPKDDKGGFLNFASNVQGFVFPSPGEFIFDLSVDGKTLGSLLLPVKEKQ